ncbi:phosphoenolpyruvate carboxykinase (ATP) [Acaryochloris marina]|uniref:HPr kinase/phosphorylase C-terminal domain-containing protein n=1 Tax=Acaryochloris marina (strain MBIC 11017) TaxID=329726 RepID=B0CEG9_ACAM1|nr:hypothetical protein [Acaryochloris marina]ABW26935.1 conserved hypothetical protein [Acaryochloris marina MBIC11017]BDM81703.1 hypothetical protein AM10699_45700 [Acaryochloris marina MBIC10699]
MSHFYSAYGLTLQSEIKLPELIPTLATDADVWIHFDAITDSPLQTGDTLHCYQNNDSGMYLYWQGVGTFLIQEGQDVLIDLEIDLDEDRLRLFILGAVMGVVLHQRGFLVLHASAVALEGEAVAFIGQKRWGKSTMAATLHDRGHSLIADDVVALEVQRHQIQVQPAFPQIKLWPDAVTCIGKQPEDLPRLGARLEKRNHQLSSGFMSDILPLRYIFVLGQGEEVAIKPLPPQEIIQHLMQNSYVTRFEQTLLQERGANHFKQLMLLAQQVPLLRLLRPASLDLLPDIATLVENHILAHEG